MSTRIQHRRDTAANWTAANPVLASGEFGVETNTGLFKHGDGVTAWNTLAYAGGGGGSTSDATTVLKGRVRLGADLGGTADDPWVVSGEHHTHTAVQVSDSTVTGRALMTAVSATTARDTLSVPSRAQSEALVAHDGSAGGGTRPTGFFRVIWVGGATRPTNMATDVDIWEQG